MKKRTSNVSRRIVSLLMSMVLTLTLVTPAAFATEVVDGSGTTIVEGNTNPDDLNTSEDAEGKNDVDKNTEDGKDEQPADTGDEDKNPGEGEGDDANKPDEDKKDEAPDGENKDEQPTEDENNGEDEISLLNDENGTDVWGGESEIAEKFAGGTGTESDPYQISTGAELAFLATKVNAGTSYSGEYFKLTKDIRLNELDVPTSGNPWNPIGNNKQKFQGTFDGNGYTIRGLYISAKSSYQGLFGYTTGTVKNLIVIGNVQTNNRKQVAGVVGKNDKGYVVNCGFYGSVTASTSSSGGVVGSGNATNCWYFRTNENATVLGVCGSTATNCYQNVPVSKKGTYYKDAAFEKSTEVIMLLNDKRGDNKAWKPGEKHPEFLGTNEKLVVLEKFLSAPMVEVKVEGGHYAVVDADKTSVRLTGEGAWYKDSSGWKEIPSDGIEYKLDGLLTTIVYGSKDAPTATDWYKKEGAGAADTPYEISNASELFYFAKLVNGDAKDSAGKDIAAQDFSGKVIKLTADIDLGSQAWTPIGKSDPYTFAGEFYGQGHRISNLNVPDAAYPGLFGNITGAVIQDLIVTGEATGAYATYSKSNNVGGICNTSKNNSKIQNCGFYGVLTDVYYSEEDGCDISFVAGGIVGSNGKDCTVSNCWFYDTTENGQHKVYGKNSGTVEVCYTNVNATKTQVGVTKVTAEQFKGTGDDESLVSLLNGSVPTGCMNWAQGEEYPIFTSDNIEQTDRTVSLMPLFPDCKFAVSVAVEGEDVAYDEEKNVYTVSADTTEIKLTRSDGETELWVSADASGKGATKITSGEYTLSKAKTTLYYGTETDFAADITWWYSNQQATSYDITTVAQLRGIARLVNSGRVQDGFANVKFWLRGFMNSLALYSIKWEPIGTEDHPFKGVVEGKYRSINTFIDGLTVADDYANAGLFGVVDGGTISDVELRYGTVTGSGNVGSLVGWLKSGKVENCMSLTVVSGSENAVIGGLVGLNEGTVSGCYYYNTDHMGMPVNGETTEENGIAERCFYLVEDGNSTFGAANDTGAREKQEFKVGRVTYELNSAPNNPVWYLDESQGRPTLKNNGKIIGQLTLTPAEQELPEGVTAELKLGSETTIVLTNGKTQYVYGELYSNIAVTVENIAQGYQIVFDPAPQNGQLKIGWNCSYKLVDADTAWYTDDPNAKEYVLTTASQLEGLAVLVNGTAGGDVSFKGKTIKLGNDIELVGAWTPIAAASGGHFFEGIFDGQEYTIKGLCVNTNDTYAGLFGYVRYGTIKNLTVEGSVRSTTGNSNANTGGIVGYLYRGTVENCTNNAEVTAVMGNVGGVVGHASEGDDRAFIENCTNNAAVTVAGSDANSVAAGGIVGSAGDKVIVRICVNTGNITANSTDELSNIKLKTVSAGGVGGRRVLNSYNIGKVEIVSGTADRMYAGGISADGFVDSCQNDGDVHISAKWSGHSSNDAGGITGAGAVTNSYNTAAVMNNFTYADGATKSQNGIAAGIAANPTSSIFNCYNTGDVSSAKGVAYGLGGVGTKNSSSKAENSYYVCEVNGAELVKKYVSTAGAESDVTYIEADKVYMVDAELLVDLLNKNRSGGTPWFVDETKNHGLPMFILSWDGKNMDASKKIVYVTYESGTGIYRTTDGLSKKDILTLEKDVSGEFQPVSYTVLGARDAGVAHTNGSLRVWMANDGKKYAENTVISVSDDITLTAQWDEIWVGNGTAADPYQLPDGEKLAALAEQVNEAGFDYAGEWFSLTQDIDLGNFVNWTPIGNGATPSDPWFSGNLDGNGKSISGLSVNSSNSVVGLFGRAKNGTFKDFKLSGTVTGSGYSGVAYVGSLIGHGSGVVLDSIEADVTVSGGGQTGGLVGYDLSRADRCVVHGSVTGGGYVGGISTRRSNNNPAISDCHNYATITSTGSGSRCNAAGIWACDTNSAAGRFTGCTNNGTIKAYACAAGIATAGYVTGCINYGSVTSTNFVAAGISNNGNAVKCGNTGTITGYGEPTTEAHGVAGITDFDKGASFCYNTGNVICTYNKNWAYGIAAGGAISNSFSYVTGKDIALAPNTLAEGKVINSYYLASKKDAVSSAGEYATLADFASGKVAWGVDGGTGAHKNYWTQDTQRGNNQLPAGPGRAYPKPIEDPNTEFSVYRALVQYGTGGTASLEANGHSSENQENAVYGMKGTSVTVTATPKDDTFGLKSLTLDLMGTGSTTALESGDSFTLGEANALVVAAFASTGNGGNGGGTGGNGGDGDGTGTDTGDGAGDEDDEGLQDGLNLEVEYDVKNLILSAYGAWGAESSGKTFAQWLKDSPEVLRALITNSLDNMAVAAMGKKTDEAKDLAALLLASLNEHSGLDGQSSDTIGKMLRKYIESGTEAAFSAWLTTGGGMASGTYESIFAQYTNSLLALADRLYTNWESSGTSLTFPQWLDAQQVTMESLSENAEEPDAEPDDTQTTEAPEDVPDGQEAEGGASSGGNSVWEVIGTVVRENPIIVWSIVAVIAALVIVGAVRRYHKVKRDERDDVTSKK